MVSNFSGTQILLHACLSLRGEKLIAQYTDFSKMKRYGSQYGNCFLTGTNFSEISPLRKTFGMGQ